MIELYRQDEMQRKFEQLLSTVLETAGRQPEKSGGSRSPSPGEASP